MSSPPPTPYKPIEYDKKAWISIGMTRCEPSMLTCWSIPHNIKCTGSYELLYLTIVLT